MLPSHLRSNGEVDSWEETLNDRIAGAPGYMGTHQVTTDSMASDSWDVHWAMDGAKAATAVESHFKKDFIIVNKWA